MGKKNINQAEKLTGASGFEKYYSEIYGNRWLQLKNSLLDENVYAEVFSDGKESYFLDPASVFASCQLPLDNADSILDMCAAPGGKTLILANRMNESASLVSNERSLSRKQRLVQVCDNCLPEDIRQRMKISCSDASKWCTTQTECYDAILLDAPCSSERHVLADEKYLSEWSVNRIKTLSMEQWALLSCGWRLLKKGGYLLYSTCALCPRENDEVVKRLFKKFDNVEEVFGKERLKPEIDTNVLEKFCRMKIFPGVERTECGFHILPDSQNGCGPIWFTLLRKM